ncbi:hypothetical protein Q5752_007078 [Cryptotrichosporon argae]
MARSPEYSVALATSLRWDDDRGEPYIQLPSFPYLRLTPFREGIEDELVDLFNVPMIAHRLFVTPTPYTRAHAAENVTKTLPTHRALCAEVAPHLSPLHSADPKPDTDPTTAPPLTSSAPAPTPIAGMPFKSIRSLALGRIVGDIHLHVDTPPGTSEDEQLARPADEQVWAVGYVLDPAMQGKGVMAEVLGCILEAWVKPWMRVGALCATAETNNPASLGVLKRNGFDLHTTQPCEWPADKGGGVRETSTFVLRLSDRVKL